MVDALDSMAFRGILPEAFGWSVVELRDHCTMEINMDRGSRMADDLLSNGIQRYGYGRPGRSKSPALVSCEADSR